MNPLLSSQEYIQKFSSWHSLMNGKQSYYAFHRLQPKRRGGEGWFGGLQKLIHDTTIVEGDPLQVHLHIQ